LARCATADCAERTAGMRQVHPGRAIRPGVSARPQPMSVGSALTWSWALSSHRFVGGFFSPNLLFSSARAANPVANRCLLRMVGDYGRYGNSCPPDCRIHGSNVRIRRVQEVPFGSPTSNETPDSAEISALDLVGKGGRGPRL